MSYNIYICGVGGQGIIKTSVIIGEAAMNQGLNVVMSEIHGMSQRGGSVSTELKIGDFNSSIIPEGNADMLLSFEPIETIRGLHKVNKDSKIVYNTHPIVPSSTNVAYPSVDSITNSLKENFNHVLPIDATKLAMEAGNILSLNMVLLGAVTADDKFPLSKDTVIDAMKNNLHKKFHDLNLKAIESGYKSIKG
ncbi:indolepyruvate oxidoreductase subunit beta [Methanobrevibacter millerae]|jgi:indolepyruvate ferredoxin oxidoreductase beta subunit|uniref:Indolepyruvate ferredoxin oxidoreductase subunit beta n=1 Tax=Methanobrevibacter millerae TaxID=230361 RepID=A0A0U3EIM9_9EURY|nr:indolepyruvate oxidoreductase subunit beta [Methanobrevibacter millerae]ALT68413.1 indolepyruvate ferredoxin oxidoreductase beta subunit IorB [Methanobrevibacter millerae]MBO6109895.1 indolepyruvate oxidoreductase subunit beta [Methanobrevibacter sp.]MBP3226827.1 indolepyruvate oxidoreductase subunit beta [Methanobrevibacter sp.]